MCVCISKTVWAKGLKLGQLIGNDEYIVWCNFKKKITLFFWSYGPLKIWAFLNFSATYLKNYLS